MAYLSPTGEVSVASESDRAAVTAALAEAFMDDPVAIWAAPKDRHSFRATAELHLPNGGPVIYPMWREPR